MDKNDIRIGDVVEVKFQATVTGKNGDYANLDVTKTVVALEYYLIDKIVTRKETKDEKLERLEARVKELEAENVGLAQEHVSRYRQRFPNTAAAWPTPWYPPQQEGYGPWIEGPVPVDATANRMLLTAEERAFKTFHQASTFKTSQTAVAHCIKLED